MLQAINLTKNHGEIKMKEPFHLDVIQPKSSTHIPVKKSGRVFQPFSFTEALA